MLVPQPPEVTFVSISPDRAYHSPASGLHSRSLSHWSGISPEAIGRPQGLRPFRSTGPSTESRPEQLLSALRPSPDKRPSLLHFSPVQQHQLATQALPTHTYAKGKFLQQHQLLYRTYNSESLLVRSVLELAGFHPTDSHDWNVLWLSGAPLDYLFKGLNEHQRINHFPRTVEITRKDRLCAAMDRLKERSGGKACKFFPETYVLPQQLPAFQLAYEARHCPWILKPCASSQGRGISLLDPQNAPLPTDSCVVSRYIDDPLLVNGLKFDLRLYVLVSSMCPLRVYLYEEGLTRFASEPFAPISISKSRFIHLTNYSVNKKNALFQQNCDEKADNIGHKWSLSALFRHLEAEGRDIDLLWARIYDLIVKTVLGMEENSVKAMEKLGIHRGNCFDLLGFDVILDRKLRPWLLEVNLSPSLAVDSPLDLLIKSTLLSDAFNLIGVRAFDRKSTDDSQIRARIKAKRADSQAGETLTENLCRDLLRDTLEEYSRRGHFLRLYPSSRSDSYDQYFASERVENKWLFSVLFQGLSPAFSLVKSQLPDLLSMSLVETTVEERGKSFVRRRNLSTDAERPFLPSLDRRKSRKTAKMRLVDVLQEYMDRIDCELARKSSLSSDWKQRFESFTKLMKWDIPTDSIPALRQALGLKVTQLQRKRELEGLYGAAKTAEEAQAAEVGKLGLEQASVRQLERMLQAAGGKTNRKAIAMLFDSGGRGLLRALQGAEKEPSSLTTEQDEGEEVA